MEMEAVGTGFVIHNGLRRQWNYLEVVDRAFGEVERISLDDPNSAESVKRAADALTMRIGQCWEILLDGGTLATFGFVRRLAK